MRDAEKIEGWQKNRAARRAAGQRGAHRGIQPTRRTAVGLVGLGTALAIVAGAGTAAAEPFNPLPPNASNPTPGTSNPTPPMSNEGPGAFVDPPAESGWRENPYSNNAPINYVPEQSGPTYSDAFYTQPTPIGPVELPPPPPMIMPEPGMIRVGTYQEVKPPWITMAEMNSINRWSAYIESRVAQYWLSQGYTLEEADQRAASMMVGGVVGGAAGFAVGVLPGAAVGAGIGFASGAAIAAGLGLPINALFPVVGTPLYGSFIGVGALAGAGAGALAGGLAGGLAMGVPGAALGFVFGGGDPNAEIDQPWTYRDGNGLITPKENKLEFDWDAVNSNILPAELALPAEAHVNLQIKTDGTVAVKLGDERWLGATPEQRDTHFYGEIDNALPGVGTAVKGFLEDENGAFQTGVRDALEWIAAEDPANAQYNPAGDIDDTTARETRVPYPTTSTPDPRDEPNRDGAVEQIENNRGSEVPFAEALPAPAPAPAPVDSTPMPVSAPVVQNVPAAAPVLPQAIQQAVDTAPAPVQQAVNDAQRALGDLIPGLLGA